MKHDAFRYACEDALRRAGVLTAQGEVEESVDLEGMARRYFVRAGVFGRQPADPFLGSLELRSE